MFPPDDNIIEFFLEAYRHGAFPMAEPHRVSRRLVRGGTGGTREVGGTRERRIDWYIPDPRAVIELGSPGAAPGDLGGFHIPRSLTRRLRSGRFAITSDRAFERVIRACAEPGPPGSGREDSWLDERLIRAYIRLHEAGHAHSVEAWTPGNAQGAPATLVGGVYGMSLGRAFCAESMFCRPELGGTDASKVALAFLARHLRERGYTLFDVQIRNRHTDQFGVVEIPAREYMDRLHRALASRIEWGSVNATWEEAGGRAG